MASTPEVKITSSQKAYLALQAQRAASATQAAQAAGVGLNLRPPPQVQFTAQKQCPLLAQNSYRASNLNCEKQTRRQRGNAIRSPVNRRASCGIEGDVCTRAIIERPGGRFFSCVECSRVFSGLILISPDSPDNVRPPDIVGSAPGVRVEGSTELTGAFWGESGYKVISGGALSSSYPSLMFKASLAKSTYSGDSVQPSSARTIFAIKI